MTLRPTRQQRRTAASWGIPLAYALVSLVVGFLFPRLENRYLPRLLSSISAPAAMAICSSIASGMITLTGIVFAMTFVMVQFSATAYSPRLVFWVSRDRVLAHALGVFTATFLYALMLLGWVDRSASGEVPLISGWLVMGLLLASMGLFIALIDRVGLLRVNRMLIFTGDQGRKAIDQLYPSPESLTSARGQREYRSLGVTQTVTHVGRPQVIQAVRVAEMVRLAERANAVVEMVANVGDTVSEKALLLRVYGARQTLDERALKRAVERGDERTFDQDPKYALRLVVDIAIRALSAAINDPTTAVQALDQVEDLLLRLGSHQLNIGHYRDSQGAVRLIIPFPSWDDFLRLALDEVRFCGAHSVQVMRRMRALTRNLLAALPVERHATLLHWELRLQNTIGRSFADSEEKEEAWVADRQGLGIGEERDAGDSTEDF